MAPRGKGCPGQWHTAAFVRVAESHGHPILAGPWGDVKGGGLIMGLRLPPLLWAGGFPTGMMGAGRWLGAQP